MCWTFDRIPRLEALIARARRRAELLGRERFDSPRGTEARRLADRRLELVDRRVRRLCLLARAARHNAQLIAY